MIDGTLTATGGTWLGQGAVESLVTSSSGIFTLTGNLSAPKGLALTGGTLAGPGTLTGSLTDTSSASETFAGTIAGPASIITMNKAGATLTLTGANTNGSATTVTAGILQVGDGTTPGATTGSNNVTVASAGTLTTDLAGGESFGNGVVDNGHVIATGTTNNYGVTNVISGTGNLTKTGANTVTVTAANTYKGGTTVSAGTLLVNNTTGSGTGTGAVTIANGGTLGGSGTITGATTLSSGGILEPGAGSVGTPGTTLHGASLIWNGGGTLTLQLGSTSFDALALTGALTKGTAGAYTLDILDDGGIPLDQLYRWRPLPSTTFAATTFTLDMPGNYVGNLVVTSTKLTLDVTAGSGEQPAHEDSVASSDPITSGDPTDISTPTGFGSDTLSPASPPTPEPGSALLLAFGGAGLLGWRRRRCGLIVEAA